MTTSRDLCIDCDIHPLASKEFPVEPFVPQDMRETLRQGLGGAPGSGYQNPFGVNRRDANCTDPQAVARDHLDRYGLTFGVIQPPGLGVSITNQIDVGTAMARAWNDWQVEHWLAADKRFLGSICLNVNDPGAAVAEIRRVAEHPQMVQLNLPGESRDLYGHRRYWPIWEVANDLELPVCLHPGREGSYDSVTPIGRPSTYFEWHTVIPLTFQAHLVSLVLDGVFERFRNLRFVLCEGGTAWLPHTVWRMDKNFKALRSTTPWLKRAPSEYVIDHVRLTSQPLEEPEQPDHMLAIFEMLRAERTLMFATDFPHWDFDDPDWVLPRKTPQALRERIMYDTAAELYGLPSRAEMKPKLAGVPA